MTHRAESITAAVVTKLTGLTTTGGNVYRGRPYAVQAAELPCLLIYLGAEEKLTDLFQGQEDWALTINVVGRVKSPIAQIETEINKIREQVHVALMTDVTQGLSYVFDTNEGEPDEPEISAEGNQPVGEQRWRWRFHYRRSRANPGA